MTDPVRYCPTAAGRVAYTATGSGPVLLVEPGWVSHLHTQLGLAGFGAFVAGLATSFTVVRFDKPGCGLSDRDGVDGGFAAQVDAALAVVDAVGDTVGTERFSVFGASQGGQVALALAAQCPERVDALVLFGTCADGADLAPPAVRDALLGLVAAHWGLGSRVLTELFLPGADPEQAAAFTRVQRAAASPTVARDLLGLYYATDVTGLLGRVRARTAVLHREGDTATAFDLGRRVAAGVPGAVLVPLAGSAHLFYAGDVDAVLEATLRFLRETAGPLTESIPPTEVVPLTETVPLTEVVPLTARELEVARLVAEGLTNHAVASRLGIRPRTVDTHVENVRRKLGVRSRTQVAVWVTEHAPPAPRPG